MKKIFLNLFLVAALSFGLQSCSEEDACDDVTCGSGLICDDGTCVTDPNADCDVCGTYDGTLNGTVTIGTLTPPLSNEQTTVLISKSGSDYSIEIDLVDAIGIVGLTPTATGTYDASTKTITFDNAEYVFDISGGAPNPVNVTFVINGTVVFNAAGTVLDADIDLSSPAGAAPDATVSGNILVAGTK